MCDNVDDSPTLPPLSQPAPTLDRLPPELLLHILDFGLPPPSVHTGGRERQDTLRACSLVCSSIRPLAQFLLRRDLVFRAHPHAKRLRALLKDAEALRRFDECAETVTARVGDADSWRTVVKVLSTLSVREVHLTVDSCCHPRRHHLKQYLSVLQSLHLTDTRYNQLFQRRLSFPSLVTLSFHRVDCAWAAKASEIFTSTAFPALRVLAVLSGPLFPFAGIPSPDLLLQLDFFQLSGAGVALCNHRSNNALAASNPRTVYITPSFRIGQNWFGLRNVLSGIADGTITCPPHIFVTYDSDDPPYKGTLEILLSRFPSESSPLRSISLPRRAEHERDAPDLVEALSSRCQAHGVELLWRDEEVSVSVISQVFWRYAKKLRKEEEMRFRVAAV